MKRTLLTLSLAAMLSACNATSETAQSVPQKPKYETYITAGEVFPLQSVVDINGKSVSLTEQNKRKLVILFATWCSDSQRTISQLMKSSLAQDKNLTIVGIGREENTDSLVKFEQDFATNFSLVADPDRKLYSQFANAGIPRLILLDEQNKVVKTLIGEAPDTIEKVTW